MVGSVAAQPAPEPTAFPTPESSTPPDSRIKVAKKRKFLAVVGEKLNFPDPPSVGVPSETPLARWEKLTPKGWSVTGLQAGRAVLTWSDLELELIVQERALRWLKAKAKVALTSAYPRSKAIYLQALQGLHREAELKPVGQLWRARAVGTEEGPGLIGFEGPLEADWSEAPPVVTGLPQLVLSNWPEKVDQDQVLLDQSFEGSARVMIHHRNLPAQPTRWLEVELSGQGQYLLGSWLAGPSPDEIFAGHLAAAQLLRNPGQGVKVSLGERPLLVEHSLFKPSQTISVMQSLQALGKARARLRVLARSLGAPAPSLILPLDAAARTTRGLFPGEVSREINYLCGAAYHFEELGGPPYLKEMAQGHPSPGNFGSVFRYRFQLNNSSESTQDVRLELSARGGPARACLVLEGLSLETDLLKAEPKLVKRWVLAPGELRLVSLDVFPQAGSNYPLSFTLSSRVTSLPVTPSEAGSHVLP